MKTDIQMVYVVHFNSPESYAITAHEILGTTHTTTGTLIELKESNDVLYGSERSITFDRLLHLENLRVHTTCASALSYLMRILTTEAILYEGIATHLWNVRDELEQDYVHALEMETDNE